MKINTNFVLVMLQFVKHLKRWLSGGTRLLFQKLTLVDIKAGKGFYPRPSFYVARGFKVRIGDNVYIGRCAHIAADVTIGNDVLIASSVSRALYWLQELF